MAKQDKDKKSRTKRSDKNSPAPAEAIGEAAETVAEAVGGVVGAATEAVGSVVGGAIGVVETTVDKVTGARHEPGGHHAAKPHGRPATVDETLPATREELMARHADARARRAAAPLGSDSFRDAVDELGRIEIRIAAIEEDAAASAR
jgi:hypothetical protein